MRNSQFKENMHHEGHFPLSLADRVKFRMFMRDNPSAAKLPNEEAIKRFYIVYLVGPYESMKNRRDLSLEKSSGSYRYCPVFR